MKQTNLFRIMYAGHPALRVKSVPVTFPLSAEVEDDVDETLDLIVSFQINSLEVC